MKVSPISCKEEPSHDTGIVVLQNCLDSLKAESRLYSDACETASGNGSQVLGMNIVEARNVQEDEDPLLLSPVIKVEHEVSCPEFTILFLISIFAT
jgi:hypothetical protein